MDPELAEFGRLLHLRKGGGTNGAVKIGCVYEPPAVMKNICLRRKLQITENAIDSESRHRYKDLYMSEIRLRDSLRRIRNREKEIRESQNQDNRRMTLTRTESMDLKNKLLGVESEKERRFLPEISNSASFLVTGGFQSTANPEPKRKKPRGAKCAQTHDCYPTQYEQTSHFDKRAHYAHTAENFKPIVTGTDTDTADLRDRSITLARVEKLSKVVDRFVEKLRIPKTRCRTLYSSSYRNWEE